MVVRNTKDHMWTGFRCGQDGLSLFQSLVRVNVETLTVPISLESRLGPNLASLACGHAPPLPHRPLLVMEA